VKLVYLEPAKRDFERTRDYYLAQEVNSEATNSIIGAIITDINHLQDHPELGFTIGGKYGYQSAYRGLLVCKEHYLAVYEVLKRVIEVRRVYSTKENYIRDLLP